MTSPYPRGMMLYPPMEGAAYAAYPYNGWTIADGGGWLPGIYDTEQAARLAFTIGNETLQVLSDRVCLDGQRAITIEDLESL